MNCPKGPTMLKSRLHSSLLFVSGIVLVGAACSSAEPVEMVQVTPTAGTSPGASGSGSGGSSGAAATTAGSPGTAGTGTAGSVSTAGTGTGGAGNAGSSGVAGGTTGGAGGTAGGSGGAGGTGGMGGTGTENKVILFDGSEATFKSWKARNGGADNPWTNNGDGTMTVKGGTGDIITKMGYRDIFLHVEYRTPKIDVSPADPQQRGNSGVYMKGSYEMQVLDTFGFAPKDDYCGAVYKISAPLVSACKMANEWNTYDIEFKANVCTNGTKTTNAKFVEVKLNDMLVQKDVVADRKTEAGLDETCDPRGVLLQDHGTVVPVSFRNIWAIPRN
jgi:hypothetical protein